MRGMILHTSPSTVHTQLPNPDSFPISSTVAPQMEMNLELFYKHFNRISVPHNRILSKPENS
jgi:hypothetical protein